MKNICIPFFGAMTLMVSLLVSQSLWAANFTAQVFEMNADPVKDNPIYKVKHDETLSDDGLKFHNVYSSNDGKEALIEEVALKGTDVLSYHVNHIQVGEEGNIEVKDKKVLFTYKKKDHEAKTAEENYVDNLVIGPSVVPYVQKHWAQIKAGEKVSVRLAVPDRRETVGFDLFKDKTSTDAKTVVKMKASSLVISALVDPLYFTFLPDGTRMTEMKGRTPFKREHDGQFTDLDAHTIYKFE